VVGSGEREAGGCRGPGRAGAFAAVLLLASAFGACSHAHENLPSDHVWSSDHFDYFTRSGDTSTCADVLGPLEEHFALVQGSLGFAWPAGTKVRYYKFLDGADFQSNAGCPPEAGGCAPQTNVEASDGMDLHELVHAYLYPTGFPPSVLIEGVAVALSCQSVGYPKPTVSWDQLATMPRTMDLYAAGAWLVGYLLDVFDPQKFTQLYAALTQSATAQDLATTFQSIYGESLADVWAAALAENEPRYACLWQCSRPSMALDGSAASTAGTCGTEVVHPFTLPAESTFSLFSTQDLSLGPCGRVAPPQADIAALGTGAETFYHLPAGSYFVQTDPATGSVVGKRDVSAALNPACASVTDGADVDPNANVYVAVPSSTAQWFMALPPPGRSMSVIPVQGLASFSLCASCDPTSCAPVPTTRDEPWSAGSVLMLATDPSVSFTELGILFQ
jgi:hypothetical protein